MKTKQKFNSFLYNHLWLKRLSDYIVPLFVTLLSAVIFSFGLNAFIQPDLLGLETHSMVSGGASGAAQVIKTACECFGVSDANKLKIVYNAMYVLINVPLLILAYFGVGKKFAIYTIINVGAVVGFNFLLTLDSSFLYSIAEYVNENGGGMLARAFFAGICTGLSSSLAYKIDSSAGGFDIVSYYISNKKSTLAGKYGVIINSVIVGSFAIVSAIKPNGDAVSSVISVCFSLVYMLAVMVVIDIINIRNKKAQIQIITSNEELPKLLISNIPHGATFIDAKGVFTDDKKIIIYMVVSTTEVKRSVEIIKALDPESFVNVTQLEGVYGNFHMKHIK